MLNQQLAQKRKAPNENLNGALWHTASLKTAEEIV